MRTLILLTRFIGNGTCVCELIEQNDDCKIILTHGWKVLQDEEIGRTIKRRNFKKLNWTINSVNIHYHIEAIENVFGVKVLQYELSK